MLPYFPNAPYTSLANIKKKHENDNYFAIKDAIKFNVPRYNRNPLSLRYYSFRLAVGSSNLRLCPKGADMRLRSLLPSRTCRRACYPPSIMGKVQVRIGYLKLEVPTTNITLIKEIRAVKK